MKAFSALTVAIVVMAGLSSCSTLKFYTQAAGGQMEMLRKARPVGEVKADPKSKPLLRQKLDTVADILDFAEKELRLPAKDQYRRYANLGRRYAVWVVFAAPEFSVTPKTWSYPLLGKLAYRGFFKEALATEEADKLRAEGYDVYVSGVEAYSTLGFFRDPLLNTFLGRADADLAELIFHELTHQRLYFRGDTNFNEAFATAVGQEGARRWLRARGRLKDLAQYEKEQKVEREFVKLALETRKELKAVYARPDQSRDMDLIEKKSTLSLFEQRALALDRRNGGAMKIERWFKKPVNNARLGTLSSYYEMLPGFEAMLVRREGNLETFFDDVDAMHPLKPEARRKQVMQAIPSR